MAYTKSNSNLLNNKRIKLTIKRLDNLAFLHFWRRLLTYYLFIYLLT